MPDGSKISRIVPKYIQCMQHGGHFDVEAARILTHTDGSRHVYVFAECGDGSMPRHEFGEYLRPAE